MQPSTALASLDWASLFQQPVDVIGFALFLLVFPIYHGVYPLLAQRRPGLAAKGKVDVYRRSWIEGILANRDTITAVQQTRNLAMVNSLLASSSLILMGFTANVLIRTNPGTGNSDTQAVKLFLLIITLSVAFAYSMTSLRHLGHFNLVIGADPAVIEEFEGPPADYFAAMVNRASNRYTLAVRCLYSASPLLVWLFDSWSFLGLTLLWGVKFIGFQDFVRGTPGIGDGGSSDEQAADREA